MSQDVQHEAETFPVVRVDDWTFRQLIAQDEAIEKYYRERDAKHYGPPHCEDELWDHRIASNQEADERQW